MATYNFKCKDCDHKWQVVQSVHDPHPTQCEECESEGIRQIFSLPNTITCVTGAQINERAKALANNDWEKIKKADDKALNSLVGERVNPQKT